MRDAVFFLEYRRLISSSSESSESSVSNGAAEEDVLTTREQSSELKSRKRSAETDRMGRRGRAIAVLRENDAIFTDQRSQINTLSNKFYRENR